VAAGKGGRIHGVSLCIIRSGEVLLIKRGHAPFAGCWSLPGGKIEAGESPRRAALRELHEETGLRATIRRIVLVMDIPAPAGQETFHLTVFCARWLSGIARAASDAAQVRWATPDEVEGLRTTPHLARIVRRAMRLCPDAPGRRFSRCRRR